MELGSDGAAPGGDTSLPFTSVKAAEALTRALQRQGEPSPRRSSRSVRYLWQLRKKGITCDQLRQAGFCAEDLKLAGYSGRDLSKAGFSPVAIQGAAEQINARLASGVVGWDGPHGRLNSTMRIRHGWLAKRMLADHCEENGARVAAFGKARPPGDPVQSQPVPPSVFWNDVLKHRRPAHDPRP
mmetsp:Transcript_43073/g.103877  ORF Transcript_43073/g.103877 Transcript_43073/m.103877 type:complete len:184 (+) Transcript_43073:38-589(+)